MYKMISSMGEHIIVDPEGRQVSHTVDVNEHGNDALDELYQELKRLNKSTENSTKGAICK
jgi:hypothetical protein